MKLLTLPLVKLLYFTGELSARDVVAVELVRYKSGVPLNDREEGIALLFSHEAELRVPWLLETRDDSAARAADSADDLQGTARKVWLWVQLRTARQQWETDTGPWDIEELLDRYDDDDDYADIRLFKRVPRRERGAEMYAARIDGVLEAQRRRLNDSAQ